MGLHVKHKHDPFVKRVSRVNLNITQTCLTSTNNIFINELIVSELWIMSDFITPTLHHLLVALTFSLFYFK